MQFRFHWKWHCVYYAIIVGSAVTNRWHKIEIFNFQTMKKHDWFTATASILSDCKISVFHHEFCVSGIVVFMVDGIWRSFSSSIGHTPLAERKKMSTRTAVMRGEEVKKEIKTGERYHMEHGIIPFRRKSNKNEDENVDFVEEQKAHPYWWYYYRYAVCRVCVWEWSVNMQRETNFRSRVKTCVDVKINAANTK